MQSVKLRPRFEIRRDLAAPIPDMVCHFLFPNLCQPLFPYMYVRQYHASAAIQEGTIFQDIVRVTGDIIRAISGILGNLRSQLAESDCFCINCNCDMPYGEILV